MAQDGQTRRGAIGAMVTSFAASQVAVSESRRDLAADLVLPANIFVDVTLATAEAKVAVGATFKIVYTAAGQVCVYKRKADGSTKLYSEVTSAALASIEPDKGAALLTTKRHNVARSVGRQTSQVLWEKPITPFDFGARVDARMTGPAANNSGTLDPNSTDDTDNFENFLQEVARGRPGEMWPRDEGYDPANPPGLRVSRPIVISRGRNNIVLKGPGRELFKIIQSDNFNQIPLSLQADFNFLNFDVGGFTITRTDPGAGGQAPADVPALQLIGFHSGLLDDYRTNRMGCSFELKDCLNIKATRFFSNYDRCGVRLVNFPTHLADGSKNPEFHSTPNVIHLEGLILQSYEVGLFADKPTRLTGRLIVEHVGAENPNWAKQASGILIQDACHAGNDACDLELYMEGVKGYGVQILDRRDWPTNYRLRGTINRIHSDVHADIVLDMSGHRARDATTQLLNECQHGAVNPAYVADGEKPYVRVLAAPAFKKCTLRDEQATYANDLERPRVGANSTRPRAGGDFNLYVPVATTEGEGVWVERMGEGVHRIYPARGFDRATTQLRLLSASNVQGLCPRISKEAAEYVEYTWEVWNGSAFIATDTAFWLSGTYI